MHTINLSYATSVRRCRRSRSARLDGPVLPAVPASGLMTVHRSHHLQHRGCRHRNRDVYRPRLRRLAWSRPRADLHRGSHHLRQGLQRSSRRTRELVNHRGVTAGVGREPDTVREKRAPHRHLSLRRTVSCPQCYPQKYWPPGAPSSIEDDPNCSSSLSASAAPAYRPWHRAAYLR